MSCVRRDRRAWLTAAGWLLAATPLVSVACRHAAPPPIAPSLSNTLWRPGVYRLATFDDAFVLDLRGDGSFTLTIQQGQCSGRWLAAFGDDELANLSVQASTLQTLPAGRQLAAQLHGTTFTFVSTPGVATVTCGTLPH
ncbi:MAG: hypothetical protein H6835_06400 [Planctomycetes bacterium]|nr:hypothetical protein [Planctomycetota bacterium]